MFPIAHPKVNPLLTPMGKLIERAIDPYSSEVNLGYFFEVTDEIKKKEDNAKDAFKAIRKLLHNYTGKNWIVVSKLLILLDTCTNNCTHKFHVQLANREFLSELKGMIAPKYQPPLIVQEKVLALINHWVDLFKNDPYSDFKAIESFYSELKTKGVELPKYNPETFNTMPSADLLIENASIPRQLAAAAGASPSVNRLSQEPHSPVHQGGQYQRLNDHQLTGIVSLNEDQAGKLNSEIDVVESNVQVLTEMLTHLQSTNKANNLAEYSEDLALVKELNKTCREMQKRITQLIGNVANENIIDELLRVNDDLNNAFLRYDRFERNLNPSENNDAAAAVSTAASAVSPNRTGSLGNNTAINYNRVNSKKSDEKPLIDFGDDDGDQDFLGKKDSELLVNSLKQFEISPQSRGAPTGNSSASASKKPQNNPDAFLDDENEIKEMENWLKLQEGANFLNDDFARNIPPTNGADSKLKSDRSPIN